MRYRVSYIFFTTIFFVSTSTIVAQISYKENLKNDLRHTLTPLNPNKTKSVLANPFHHSDLDKSRLTSTGAMSPKEDQIAPYLLDYNSYQGISDDYKYNRPLPGPSSEMKDDLLNPCGLGRNGATGGGMDLSGKKYKLISAKARYYLKHVYGVDVDDHGRTGRKDRSVTILSQ